jgi:hypothetical protein
MRPALSNSPTGRLQFSLQALFEYTTLCCLLAGLSSLLGIGPSLCLMFFGLALVWKQGPLALVMLLIAFGSTDLDAAYTTSAALRRFILTTLAAALLSFWYRWRGRHKSS